MFMKLSPKISKKTKIFIGKLSNTRLVNYSLFVLFFLTVVYSNAFGQFNYQAVLTNADGSPVESKLVILKISLIDPNTSNAIYVEKHSTATNLIGQIAVVVGEGQKMSGTFSSIDYGLGINLKSEADFGNTGTFKEVGLTIIRAVPIANQVQAKQQLSISGKELTISGGNTIILPAASGTGSSVTTDNSLVGDGSLAAPLGISASGASNGDVLGFSSGSITWTTLPQKQTLSFGSNTLILSASGGSVVLPYVATINPTAPLTGSVSANALSISINKADQNNDGYLSSTDYNTFTTGQVKYIDNSNLSSVSLATGDYVKLGSLTTSSNITIFNLQKIHVNGGSIAGSSSPTISIGNYSTFTGVTFTDCKLSGYFIKFLGCTFKNCDLSSSYCDFSECNLNDISSNLPGYFLNCQISNVSCSSGGTFENCLLNSGSNNDVTCNAIFNCELMGAFQANRISNCLITNSTIKAKYLISGNQFRNSWLEISNTVSEIVVENNTFSNVLSGKSEIIAIDMSGSYYRAHRYSNNTFMHGTTSSVSQSVKITGTHSGYIAALSFTGNIVTYGSNFIANSSNAKVSVSSNTLQNCSVGVSNGGNNIVQSNNIF